VLNWTPRTRGWGASRRGEEHTRNEDAFVLLDHPVRTLGIADRGCVFAVSDGVSTVAEGHWASHLTVSRLSQFFDSHSKANDTAMVSLISEIDWEIRGERAGRAACTVAVAWVHEGKAHIYQVGDSHVFRIRGDEVECLTSMESDQGRKLEHFLGMGAAVSEVIETSSHSVVSGDALMLVTDGVTAHVSAEQLGKFWAGAHGDPAAATEAILGEVAHHHGQDDATVVVALVL
jgi:serine/threonine protein phosphatase PrpC